MFDLEREIQKWRRELFADGLGASELDELEDHLRTDIDEQLSSGVAMRQAFEAAAVRIGRGRLLNTQFEGACVTTKGQNAAIMAKTTLGLLLGWAVVFTGVSCVAGFETALKSSVALLTLVLLAVAAGVIWTHRQKRRIGMCPELSEFAPVAQECLELAQVEARKLGHDYVGTEHALLALASLETGVFAGLLGKAGVSREALRQEVEKRICGYTTKGFTQRQPYTPRLKKALRLAVGEAASDRKQADAEHVLLGLLIERTGIAGCVLRSFGFSAGQVRSWLA